MSYQISTVRVRSFFDRFVHPRLAAIVLAGIVLWGVSFLIAATGLVMRSTGDPLLAVQLFFLSGIVGVGGMTIIAVCVLWLGCLRMKQIAHSYRGKRI
jgi:steroid 5-alpha reductase family enzyme